MELVCERLQLPLLENTWASVAHALFTSHHALYLRCWSRARRAAALNVDIDRLKELHGDAERPRKRPRTLSAQLDNYIQVAASLTQEPAAPPPPASKPSASPADEATPAANADGVAGLSQPAVEGLSQAAAEKAATADDVDAGGPAPGTALDALEPELRRAMISEMYIAVFDLKAATELERETAREAVMRPGDGDAAQRKAWNASVARYHDFIQHAKARGHLPGQYQGLYQAVYQRYQRELATRGAADFADLLLRTHALLRGDAAALAALRRRYRYLLVDEAQDLCQVQLSLTMMLGEGRRVSAVGDDDQAIFKFRGSEAWTLKAFYKL